jgi:NADP-dependent 3-hydroxy acid dehydrogenase YdfG
MAVQLKNIAEQVIVITGATSGIGLTTARMAAEKGAQVVLVARNEDALRQLTGEINAAGGQAIIQRRTSRTKTLFDKPHKKPSKVLAALTPG